MNIAPIKVEAFDITDAPGLDRIKVISEDMAPGKGQITIICFGECWTFYWGGMGDNSVRRFFLSVGDDYILSKVTAPRGLMNKTRTRQHEDYLRRIIWAVKDAIRLAESQALDAAADQLFITTEEAEAAKALMPRRSA